MNDLNWKKYPVLNDGFICLVDHMGTDASICQAARVSYDADSRTEQDEEGNITFNITNQRAQKNDDPKKDADLIRYLLRHGHTTPFEMVEIKFLVRVPMDCWRQWIRHRTASVNEYSTRYTEAIDSQQTTSPEEWRLQATNNKQGSSGFLEEWPDGEFRFNSNKNSEGLYDGCYLQFPDNKISVVADKHKTPGAFLTEREEQFLKAAKDVYQERLSFGVAKEQARKDLPLSTYTEAYWKCDLHNIFNFLRLRMDSHAQLEIRLYANAMAEIVKQLFPIAWQAFEDYQLNSMKLTAKDISAIKEFAPPLEDGYSWSKNSQDIILDRIFTNKREREECIAKLIKLGIL